MSGTVTLQFNPFTLQTCVSSQLQSVGELCPDQDHCTVHCMSNTIKFSVKKEFTTENKDKESVNDKRQKMKNKVVEWLKSTLALPEYADNFISNGFDRFDAITSMTKDDLKEGGVKI